MPPQEQILRALGSVGVSAEMAGRTRASLMKAVKKDSWSRRPRRVTSQIASEKVAPRLPEKAEIFGITVVRIDTPTPGEQQALAQQLEVYPRRFPRTNKSTVVADPR